MIRHTLAEGWLLIRQRALVSITLAFALALPICLAGFSLVLNHWLGPLVEATGQARAIPVLLHPHMDQEQRDDWLNGQVERNPDWLIEVVAPEDLARRLIHWFPYLTDLLEEEGASMLPPLVEITTDNPQSLDGMSSSPAVIAVGPRSSLHAALKKVAGRLGWWSALVSTILLASAGLLAAIWVHLEIYRHADEITIMRLIGATEAAVRGPFLLAVAAPGALAAVIAVGGTLVLTRVGSAGTVNLGLPPLPVLPGLLIGQACLACLLPLAMAAWTLARHATADFDR